MKRAAAWNRVGNRRLSWYRRGAECGDPVSMCNLGLCYRKGCGVGKRTRFRLLALLSRVEMGSLNAGTVRACAMNTGIGASGRETGCRVIPARRWNTVRPADRCCSPPSLTTGSAWKLTLPRPCTGCARERIKRYGEGMYRLGVCYEYGDGVEQNWGACCVIGSPRRQRVAWRGNDGSGILLEKGCGVEQKLGAGLFLRVSQEEGKWQFAIHA